MNKPGYYSSGQLMKIAHITKKAVRYYDEHNILKPSYVAPSGARFYTDSDLAKLQQILLLKSLGFSLDDIRQMTIHDADHEYMKESLKLQQRLVEDKIDQLQVILQTINETRDSLANAADVNWSEMLAKLNVSGMEQSLKNQYQNSSNISARISLHSLYASNKQGWFPWIFKQCQLKDGMKILEVGCGDGSFWLKNLSRIPANVSVLLSDVSDGMMRDVKRAIGDDARFSFQCFDCQELPLKDGDFDLVIANHVLFYCDDIKKACSEIMRVLKPGGTFICSTYGADHMKEVSELVSAFDDRIVLSADKLYERFGKENGASILKPYFQKITWMQYEDSLFVPDFEPLISYVLSCHGNQNQYILDRYKEFRSFVKKQSKYGFSITKDAGIFVCQK